MWKLVILMLNIRTISPNLESDLGFKTGY